MNPSPHIRNDAADPALPVARIEGQDSELVNSLREYLERFGCRVSVNRESAEEPLYVIAIGDAGFVKTFFEGQYFRTEKKLAVVYEGDEEDIASVRSQKIKFFFTDPVPMTQDQTNDIFSFFFTSQEKIKSNRKGHARKKNPGVTPQQPSREQVKPPVRQLFTEPATSVAEDERRVSETIKQIFTSPSSRRGRGGQRFGLLAWIFIGIAAITAPLMAYAVTVGIGIGLLAASSKAIVSGNYAAAEAMLSISTSYIRSAKTMVDFAAPVVAVIGKTPYLEDQERMLSILSDIVLAETNTIGILSNSKRIAAGILVPDVSKAQVGISDVMTLSTNVRRVAQLLGLVSAELNTLRDAGRLPFRMPWVADGIERGQIQLQRVRDVIGYTEKLLTVYPRIGGFRKKQTYLVLLQNSMELRPTGGFIGSLMLISFIDGKVDSMEIQDVYTADGQLKGHVDPPQPIREILGSEHWYLRDSNWNPDFEVSGKQAAWFYEKELGVTPDGVIAISLPMVTRLLHVTGPLELLEFNERVSESNFYAKSLLYTQTDFFPGSTQKKDFLGSLSGALMGRLTTDRSISAGALLSALTQSLRSKDLQFYFTDPELQALVSQWGWDGDLSLDTCPSPVPDVPCIGDGTGIVGANLGVNKVNYFVRDEALTRVRINADGSLDHTLTLTVENTSPSQENGGGVYQSYMRLIVPRDAMLQSITIDGQPAIPRDVTDPVPPPSPYYLFEDKEDISLIHLSYAVQPRQTRQIVFHYVRPAGTVTGNTFAYRFRLRKQPGVDRLPWHVVLQYPESWGVQSSDAVANNGELRYNTDLTNDTELRVVFTKNL